MKYIQIYANPEMCLKYLFLGSKRSVLTELIFVQGNNHAADDINSCEFSVNAADHIILCCMDFRIFWNFFMLQDTQKSNAVRHYKFMLSWHSILCCSWQIRKRWLHFFCVDSSISHCVLPLIFVQGNNHAADDINSCEYTVNAAGHIYLCCLYLKGPCKNYSF